jgi:hypothetical protein
MTETPVKREQLEAGDIARWADGVHGPSRGRVLAEEMHGGVTIAMDTLSSAKPVVFVTIEDFVVEVPDKTPETPPTPQEEPEQKIP